MPFYQNGQPVALYRGGQPMALYRGGRLISSPSKDPHYDNVVLLIEGSGRDYSKYRHPVTAVGGASFSDGIFKGNRNSYFEIDDPEEMCAVRFSAGNVFTIEWASWDHDTSGNDVGVVFGAGGATSDGNNSVIASTGTTIAARGRNIIRLSSAGAIAGSLYRGSSAYGTTGLKRQAIVYDATGVRWYVEGAFGQGGSTGGALFRFSAGGKLHISGGIPSMTYTPHGVNFHSLRITKGVARYTGVSTAINGNYTPPGSFLD